MFTIKSAIPAIGLAGAFLLVSSPAGATIDDPQAKALMKRGGCSACHTVKTKVVGPAYKDVAANRKEQARAIETMLHAVRAGSKDVYGPIAMPPTSADRLGDADLHDLIEWILTK